MEKNNDPRVINASDILEHISTGGNTTDHQMVVLSTRYVDIVPLQHDNKELDKDKGIEKNEEDKK